MHKLILIIIFVVAGPLAVAEPTRIISGVVAVIEGDRVKLKTNRGIACLNLNRVSADARRVIQASAGKTVKLNIGISAGCK